MKKTRWFTGNAKPTRKGVYERDMSIPNKGASTTYWAFSYWDGRAWCSASETPESNIGALGKHYWQELPWRGLRKPA